MKIKEYADREMLAMNVANVLAGELKKCLLVHEFASFAVPGGTTPGPIFDMLSGIHLEWDRVHVMLTDERWVDEDHEMSNARLVRARLLTDHAAAARFMPFYTADLTAEEGAAKTARTLAPELPVSLLMLGMGADMHTASLFPGAEGLAAALDEDAPLLCPIRAPGEDIARVTLPLHVLDGAMAKHLVIYGDDKRAALERARGMPPEKAPIAAVLDDTTIHWAA